MVAVATLLLLVTIEVDMVTVEVVPVVVRLGKLWAPMREAANKSKKKKKKTQFSWQQVKSDEDFQCTEWKQVLNANPTPFACWGQYRLNFHIMKYVDRSTTKNEPR